MVVRNKAGLGEICAHSGWCKGFSGFSNVPIDDSGIIVSSFRPVVFVLEDADGMKRNV